MFQVLLWSWHSYRNEQFVDRCAMQDEHEQSGRVLQVDQLKLFYTECLKLRRRDKRDGADQFGAPTRR